MYIRRKERKRRKIKRRKGVRGKRVKYEMRNRRGETNQVDSIKWETDME